MRRSLPFKRPTLCLISLAAACLLCGLTGCGGNGVRGAAMLAPPQPPGAVTRGLPAFDELTALDRLRCASNIDYDHYNYGGGFSTLHSHVNTVSSGLFGFQASFSPSYVAGNLGSAAWCVYGFKPYGLAANTQLGFDWATAPVGGNLWVGFSNSTRHAWDWFAADPINGVVVDPAQYVLNPGGNMYVVVLLLGSEQAVLNSIRLGTGGLTAVLSVDEAGAGVGFVHHFSAAGSYTLDNSALSSFEWDWEGDGVIDETTGVPDNTHQYADEALHFARVRVTSTSGAQDWAVLPIFTYAEQEQNDTNLAADALPAFPFQQWTGNCGNADFFGDGAYDGDPWDYASFSTGVGESFNLRLLSFGETNQFIELYDADGDLLSFDPYNNSSQHSLNYTVQGDDAMPLYLRILSTPFYGGHANYLLSGSLGYAPQAGMAVQVSSTDFPLEVSFDPAPSADADGTIELYEMDYESDGIFDESNTNASAFQHSFSDAFLPFVYATLRVTDNDGNTDSDTFSYKLTNTDTEVEDNDGPVNANVVASLPASVSGSVGKGSFDGDTSDWWQFSPLADSTFTVQLQFNRGLTPSIFGGLINTLDNIIILKLYDNEGDLLASGLEEGRDYDSLTHTLTGADLLPLNLEVSCLNGGVGYSLRLAQGSPPSIVLPDLTYQAMPSDILNFDPSASVDPDGPIASWAWDYDGDGSVDTVEGPLTQTSYAEAGVYIASVDAFDAEGLRARSFFSVFVGSDNTVFDEVENNDDLPSATPLPAGSVLRFTGNLGSGGGFDGDGTDYFQLGSPDPGTTISLQLHFVNAVEDIDLLLLDANGTELARSDRPGSDYDTLNYTLGQFTPLPLYVQVTDFLSSGDGMYALSGSWE